jgi:hypothetical protein
MAYMYVIALVGSTAVVALNCTLYDSSISIRVSKRGER